jgi:AcrR family transcriptional regulator
MMRPSSDQRRSEILDAVVQVIIEVGYTEVTVADVARRAGVSTSLVHYHFSSKSELISAALRIASDEDKQLREAVAAEPGTAVGRLDRMLCGTLPVDEHDGSWLLWIETWGETRRSTAIRDVMSDLNDHEREVILRLIADGERDGEFACADPDGAAARLTALRDGLAIEHTLFRSHEPTDVMIEQLRGALKNNLGLSSEAYERLAARAAVADPR